MTRFIKPNTCQIPNDFFDVLLPQLGDAELRVLLYLMRQTFGWNRDWTTGGYGRIDNICKSAGISRQGAINALKGLKERGVVEGRKVGVALEYRVCVHDVDTSTEVAQSVNVVDYSESGQRRVPNPVNDVDREPVNVVDRIKRQSSKPKKNQEDHTSGPNGPSVPAAVPPERAGGAARATRATTRSKPGPRYGELFVTTCRICLLEPSALTPQDRGQVDTAARHLDRIGATTTEVEAAEARWYAKDWRGERQQEPTPSQLATMVTKGRAERAEPGRVERATSRPRDSVLYAGLVKS